MVSTADDIMGPVFTVSTLSETQNRIRDFDKRYVHPYFVFSIEGTSNNNSSVEDGKSKTGPWGSQPPLAWRGGYDRQVMSEPYAPRPKTRKSRIALNTPWWNNNSSGNCAFGIEDIATISEI